MYPGGNGKSLILLTGLALAAQAAMPGSIAANSCANVDAQVAQGKLQLKQGKLDNAISTLSKAAQVLGTKPGSCDCHYNLGMALCKKAKVDLTDKSKSTTEFLSAKKELRTAVRVGQGNAIAKAANQYMMSNVPQVYLSPKNGEGTEMIAARLGLRSSDRGVGGAPARGKVFEFYADWCEPCKELKPVLAKVKQEYGDQVDVQSINVDDKNNAELVDQYDVSPIPTVIFMNPDGQVVGYSVGYAGEKSVEKEIQKILPNKS
ncbi:MAG TPA: thioredoxin domain-containing protein [Candidatus Obscuribacterales bacterium]